MPFLAPDAGRSPTNLLPLARGLRPPRRPNQLGEENLGKYFWDLDGRQAMHPLGAQRMTLLASRSLTRLPSHASWFPVSLSQPPTRHIPQSVDQSCLVLPVVGFVTHVRTACLSGGDSSAAPSGTDRLANASGSGPGPCLVELATGIFGDPFRRGRDACVRSAVCKHRPPSGSSSLISSWILSEIFVSSPPFTSPWSKTASRGQDKTKKKPEIRPTPLRISEAHLFLLPLSSPI
jgi:hypothetical protein